MIKKILVMLDEDIGLYTILIDNEVCYECLTLDEVADIVKEIAEQN